MKQFIIFLLLLLPALTLQGQTSATDTYLTGAVPVVDGRVVFEQEFNSPATADALYETAKQAALATVFAASQQESTQAPTQIRRQTHVEVDNAEQRVLIIKMHEWLTFKRTAFVLDRAQMSYTLVLQAKENKLTATIKNINYINEAQEDVTKAEVIRAENWITDEHGLNKKRTKLAKITGKFRAKTIDRVHEVFNYFNQAVLGIHPISREP